MSAACEPARSAGAAFRESLRSVQELVCQRNDVSRMIAECAMELAHVKQQEQNNEAEQDPGRSDPAPHPELEVDLEAGLGAGGADEQRIDDDKPQRSRQGRQIQLRRGRHPHHQHRSVLVRSPLLERSDGTAPQLHRAQHAPIEHG